MAIINGTSGDDWFGTALIGTNDDDSYFGFEGTDWLVASLGNDLLNGGIGSDLALYDWFGGFTNGVFINNTDAEIDGVAANTTDKRGFGMDALVSMENFHGTNFDDAIYLGNGEDGTYTVDFAGDDLVVAYQGADANDSHNFIAGSGNDTYIGTTVHRDRVDYNWDDDAADAGGNIIQGVDVDLAAGTATDGWGDIDTLVDVERVIGTRFDDEIRGDDARNDFWGLAGNDILDGRGGEQDTVRYSDDPAGVDVDLAAGTATDGWGDVDTLIDIERVRGSAFNDTLRGTDGNNSLEGNSGDDLIEARGGDDYLEGGRGADTLDGGTGFDVVGFFDAINEGQTTGVTVDLSLGGALDGFGEIDTLISIEGAEGTENDDTLIGDDNDNFFNGRGGNDYLEGRGGNDTLRGGDGGDAIAPGYGDDTLDGGADFDVAFYDYWNFTNGVYINNTGGELDGVAANTVDTRGFGTDTLIDVESFHGTEWDDVIHVGGMGGSWTFDRGGDDLVVASQDPNADDDHYFGAGSGNDTYIGTVHRDRVDYNADGSGNETPVTQGVNVDLAAETATDGWGDTDTLVSIERVTGTQFDDVIRGDDSRNDLNGLEGNDLLDGRGGDRDRAEYWGNPAGITADLATGTVIDGWGDTDTLIDIERISGSDFDDTIRGSDGRDDLQGRAGNDTLEGRGGDDSFTGGDGADTIDGGDGFDVVWHGNDIEDGGIAGITLDLAAGTVVDGWGNTDTLTSIEGADGSEVDDIMSGDDNDNFLDGREGNDTLSGLGGFDTFRGSQGNDVIDGGGDRDRVEYHRDAERGGTSGVVVDLSAGTATDGFGDTDTLISIEDVRGTEFDDTIIGTDGRNNIRPGAGNDVIDGGGEENVFQGDQVEYSDEEATTGITVTFTSDDDATVIDWNGDTDTLIDIEEVFGTDFADTMTGAEGHQWLGGGGGDDILSGGEGDDDLSGGNGDDTLDGGVGGDFLQPGAGSDTIIGGANGPEFQTDTIAYIHTDDVTGGVDVTYVNETDGSIADYSGGTDTFTGVEEVWGTNFSDTFTGSDGRQRFTGFGGNDTFDGGTGDDDQVSYEREQEDVGASQGVVVNLNTGTATDAYGDTDTLIGIEEIRGTHWDDTIIGDANRNSLQGERGNDTIDSFGGEDNYLEGGSGNDTFFARGDFDFVNAGDGDDTITFFGEGGGVDPGLGSDTITGVAGSFQRIEYRSLTGGVTVDFELGTTVKNDGGTDTYTNISEVEGSRGDDTLLGTDGEYESFKGGEGNDTIDGRDGFDEIRFSDRDEVAVTVDFSTGMATGVLAGTDTFSNIESVEGSLGADTFIGGDQEFVQYRGLAGDDTITGGTGIDRVSYTSDRFWGGEEGVTVNLATGTAIDGFGDTDSFTSVEQARGTIFNDSLTGDDGDNRLDGDDGDDTINGAAGDDVILGGPGTDSMTGGTGGDIFVGRITDLDGDTITDLEAGDRFYVMDADFNLIGADITADASSIYIDTDGDGVAEATMVNGSGYSGFIESIGGSAGDPQAAVVAVEGAGFFAASVAEGDAGTTAVDITFTRAGDISAAVTVDYEVAGFGDNPASSDDLVTGFGPGSVTFLPGESEATITLQFAGDATIEPNEDLRVTITGATSDGELPAEINGAETYVRILNDDQSAQVDVIGSRSTEDSGVPLTFTFTRDGDTSEDLIVTYRLQGGMNDLDADPDDVVGGLPRFGSITIQAGDSQAVLELEVVADAVTEPHENVYVEILDLGGPAAADYDIGVGEATASIRNDDGVPPEFPLGQSASNFGDPHLISLDGLAYDFQAVGEFTLIEAVSGDPLNVQVRYRPVEGSDVATRTTAIAVDIDGTRLVFDLDALSLVKLDGADLDIAAGSVVSIGTTGGALYFDGEVYTVVLSSGDQLRISARDSFLDVQVGLQPGRDVRGLLGDGDSDTANDLSLRDGTVLPQPLSFEDLYGVYADSWRIDDESSLFDYAPGQETADFTDLEFPVGVISLDDIPDDVLAAAEAAAAGIDDPVLREAAISDFILSGDQDYIDAAEVVEHTISDVAAPTDAPELESAVGVSASATEIIEGDQGAQTVLFTVYRTGDTSAALEVDYSFAGDADGSDVSGLESGTVTFDAGQSAATVSVSVLGDELAESDEEFIFAIDPGDGGPVALSSEATVTILDDDPSVSFVDGTESPDFLVGGEGDQIIRPLGGAVNLVAGGDGSDLFVFGGDPEDGVRQRLLITDYEVGNDAISLGDAEIAGIREYGSHVELTIEGETPDTIFVFGASSFDDLTLL